MRRSRKLYFPHWDDKKKLANVGNFLILSVSRIFWHLCTLVKHRQKFLSIMVDRSIRNLNLLVVLLIKKLKGLRRLCYKVHREVIGKGVE